MNHTITLRGIEAFKKYLLENEKSGATIEKYIHELKLLSDHLSGREVTKMELLKYREQLQEQHSPRTVNGKLSAIHAYLAFAGMEECRVKYLKVQRTVFMDEKQELTEEGYRRLLEAAKEKQDERLYYVMMTICSTGIRVSELKFITVGAVKRGKAVINLKGKNRVVLLPHKLQKKLLLYIKKKGIASGYVFRTRTGKPLDRSNVCHDMKKLCEAAGVSKSKVFPHNLRHLFARTFYQMEKNLAYLADILGHSSMETTRIYVAASAREHETILQKMRLII